MLVLGLSATLLGHHSMDLTLRYAKIASRTVADEYFAVTEKVEALYDNPPALPASAAGPEMAGLHREMRHDLVGELSTRSDDFRRRWGAHNVRTHGAGVKHFRHHIVGDLTLAYESLDLRAEPDLTLTIYTAEPDSPTAHALALLASWAPTEHADTAAQHS